MHRKTLLPFILSCILSIAMLTAPALAKVETVGEAITWLQISAEKCLQDSARTMTDGTTAFPPQVGIGYEAFWLRDYAYMLEGCPQAFTDQEVLDAYQVFLNAQRADGACVDCVKFDGTPIYQPGFGTMGINPVADGSQFMVDVAWHTYQKVQDTSILSSSITQLEAAMAAVPRNAATGLVYIDPNIPNDRAPYGFTDSIPKQGDLLFCSLLYVQAARQMSYMYGALDQPTQQQQWATEAATVTQSIRNTLWDSTTGMFNAATVQCDQTDIWGSAFAVYLGVADTQQTLAIANYLEANYDGLVQEGQIRHTAPGEYWEATSYQDYYQNGAYWATPTGWFVYALDKVNPELADQTFIDLVNDFEARGINEWVLDGRTQMPNYCASAALPLDAIEKIRNATPLEMMYLTPSVEGGTFGANNLARAAGAQPFALDELDYGGVHTIEHLTDGVYGNANSWIGVEASTTLEKGFVGVDLGGTFLVDSVAFGRDNLGAFTDRCAGNYVLQYTTVENPDETTPDDAWIDIGEINSLFFDSDFDALYLRHLFEFDPVLASGIRLIVPSVWSQSETAATAIDEIEVYGVAPIAGDANGDGKVDGSDVTILAGNWQYGVGSSEETATWSMGDFNGDGQVDGSDVTILAGNWQYGVDAAAASVPEPSMIALAFAGLLAIGMFRKRG